MNRIKHHKSFSLLSGVLTAVLIVGPVFWATFLPQTAQADGHTTVILTSGTSWTVPSDWNSASNTIEVIGGGGGAAHGGGSGGAYAKSSNVALTPDGTVSYAIGAAGASSTSSPTGGGNTYFCDSTSNCASITGTAVVAGAKGGGAASGETGGTGGSAVSSIGDVTYEGGDGGDAVNVLAGLGIGGYNFAGGGGGSAGPSGTGGKGGNGDGILVSEAVFGGSGGGGGHGGGALSGEGTISGASVVAEYDVSNEVAGATGVAFKSDGTKMYISDNENDMAYQYSLSTAWDITSASYDSVFLDPSGETTNLTGIGFSSDGIQLYISDTGGSVFEYELSTAWDISTATSTAVLAHGCSSAKVEFKSDGTSLYVPGCNDTQVWEYKLSTAWDISTATTTGGAVYDLGIALVLAVTATADGETMYITVSSDFSNLSLHQYSLSSPWDISTLTADGASFNLGTGEELSVTLNNDESGLYAANFTSGAVQQFHLLGYSGGHGSGVYNSSTGVATSTGGSGGKNVSDTGAGLGASSVYDGSETFSVATSGISGGGGGGGSFSFSGDVAGGDGSMASEWTDNSGGPNNGVSAGSGGGSGGGGYTTDFASFTDGDAGSGGGYGSGGGGTPDNSGYAGAFGAPYSSGTPGASQPGVIVITYTPDGEGGGESPARVLRLMDGVRLMNGVRLY